MACKLWIACICLWCFTYKSAGLLKFEESEDKTTFQRLRIDFDSRHIFVSGRNTLYKLDENLNHQQLIYTGPELDSIHCDPREEGICDDAVVSDNDARVLEIDPESRYLLHCGSIKQGLCAMHPMSDLSVSYSLSPFNRANYMGGGAGVLSFYGHWGVSNGHTNTLYSAATFDGRPIELANNAISARKIHTLPNNSFDIQYAHSSSESRTAIDFDEYWRPKYLVNYIYGFEHGGFSYFLTTQRESTYEQSDYVTKLIRVCQNDPEFNSYTEIQLACLKKNGISTTYNVALAAYIAPIGEEMAAKFALPSDERGLFVVLGKSNASLSEPNPHIGSGLCVYTMSQIRDTFKERQKECYDGRGRILPWIQRFGPSCATDRGVAMRIDEDFCGLPTNVGIEGRYPLTTETNLTTSRVASALAITVYNRKTIAIIGTTDGHILKVLLDGMDSPPYAVIDVGAGQRAPSVGRDMPLDQDHEHVYAMAGSKITKVPIKSCSIYMDCGECVNTRDPLGCGWCNNRCARQADCVSAEWKKDSCPPIIKSFHPRSGPVSGGTKVTIWGDNFGSNADSVTVAVNVAMARCDVEQRNASCIVCRTRQSPNGEIAREVDVTVTDNTMRANYLIRGKATSEHISFSFKEPLLSTFSPTVGPVSGGTQLRIFGEHLDIGKDLAISVAYQPCVPFSVQPHLIICTTSPCPQTPAQTRRSMATTAVDLWSMGVGPVNVTIDKSHLSVRDAKFHYEEDPEIHAVRPLKSIQSGGIPITVEGRNLHIVENPLIQVTEPREMEVFSEVCTADGAGMWMICPSPNITTDISPSSSILLQLHFAMDGVTDLMNFSQSHPDFSHMEYTVDPIVYDFSDYDKVRDFYMDENYLEIEGEYIDLGVQVEHVSVMLGDNVCNVTQLASTMIVCHPEKPAFLMPLEPLHRVTVTIGNLVFRVGDVQFSKQRPNIALLLVGCGVIVGVIFIIIVVVIWLKCTNRGPCAKKFKDVLPNESSVRYTEVARSNGEPIYRINHVENSYWSQSRVFSPPPVPMAPVEPLLNDEARRLIDDAALLIPREHLLLLEIIGQGHFGCVYKGVLKIENQKEEIDVAVKTLKSLTENNFYASTYDARKFLDEALRMQEFDHAHILRLIGITLDKENLPLVVLPFMKHGDLLSYIRHEDNHPTVKELMEFGIQVAKGMAYLSALKFVHRDLAARNCMLDDDMQVKVADFGLSRDIYERDYYSSDDRKAKLPVKWMSPESLEKGIYNIKTDVWSFGVVLWELMTRGVSPYPDVDNWDIIKYLKCGRRMPQPAYCPDMLYNIMLQCWEQNARMRPSFNELVTDVCQVIENMEIAHSPGINTSYINVPLTQDYLYPLHERPHSMEDVGKEEVLPTGAKSTIV